MSIVLATALALVVQRQTLSFPGGSPASLCRLLGGKLARPVACMVYDEKSVKPFELRWQDQKDLDRLMWPVGKHHLTRAGQGLGLYRGGLPSLIVDSDDQCLSKVKPFSPPKDSVEKGLVTIETADGAALKVGTLARLEFSKPLSIHWSYQQMGVAVWAKGTSEVQFLATVAAAIGARFIESQNEYNLEFDPQAYRARFLESFSSPRKVGYPQFKWGVQYTRTVENLCIETVRSITDAQLTKAFATPNGSVSFPAKRGTALYKAALGKLDAVEAASQEKDPSFRQVADGYILLLSQVDMSAQPKVVFGPPAQVGALFKSRVGTDTWIAF